MSARGLGSAAAMVAVPTVPASPGVPLDGRYRLDAPIAAGGMGEVWRATDLVLDRPVAVKMLRPGYAAREEDLARFRAEARHAGLLSHPGIAKVYDYRDGDPPYLVMELVDGPSLARLLDNGPVAPALTMSLIAQAARALQAAHAAGLVHRDIKPGNMLISRGRYVKITDFGIAHAAGSAPLTRPGVLMGTAAYLAPERAAGRPATPAADLYALGIVAYQCLSGRVPFHGDPLAVALAHREQPLPPLPSSVPADVAALVADLTAKDPSARPAAPAPLRRPAGATGPGPDASHPGRARSRHRARSPHRAGLRHRPEPPPRPVRQGRRGRPRRRGRPGRPRRRRRAGYRRQARARARARQAGQRPARPPPKHPEPAGACRPWPPGMPAVAAGICP